MSCHTINSACAENVKSYCKKLFAEIITCIALYFFQKKNQITSSQSLHVMSCRCTPENNNDPEKFVHPNIMTLRKWVETPIS